MDNKKDSSFAIKWLKNLLEFYCIKYEGLKNNIIIKRWLMI